MDDDTRVAVDAWWRDLFAIDGALWSQVTVTHPHGRLGDYDGWYVAWRADGVHVSAPSSASAQELSSLAGRPATALQDVAFWQAFARRHRLEVIGPAVHRYLDSDPGPVDDVRQVDPSALRVLRGLVERSDLWESGFDEALDEPGVVAFATDGGGAVLREVAGAPRDVSLLVLPDARGRGSGTRVGRAAASYAVRHHGWCRWRSRDTNLSSTRAAERIGFEPYATQLAVRRAASGA